MRSLVATLTPSAAVVMFLSTARAEVLLTVQQFCSELRPSYKVTKSSASKAKALYCRASIPRIKCTCACLLHAHAHVCLPVRYAQSRPGRLSHQQLYSTIVSSRYDVHLCILPLCLGTPQSSTIARHAPPIVDTASDTLGPCRRSWYCHHTLCMPLPTGLDRTLCVAHLYSAAVVRHLLNKCTETTL